MKKKPVKKKKKILGSQSLKMSSSWQKAFKKQELSDSQQEKLELVLALSKQTAALELAKNEYVEMAPLPGVCGPFRLFGNSNPVIEYRIFEQPIMEFLKIRVEISKPDRIHFIATVDCRGMKGEHTDAARHGEEIPMKEKFKEPFEKLAGHLRNYFPYYRNSLFDRTPDRKDVPKEIVSGEK